MRNAFDKDEIEKGNISGKQEAVSLSPDILEIITKTREEAQDELDAIGDYPDNIVKHTVNEDDEVLSYLLELEELYINEEESLNKARAIIVNPETIAIGGVEIKRENEKALADDTKYIYDSPNGSTFFAFIAAKKYAEEAESEGYVIPSKEDWKDIIEAMPGSNEREKTYHARIILQLCLDGGTDKFGTERGTGEFDTFWSATQIGQNDVWCMYINKDSEKFKLEQFSRGYGCSVRLIKKK